MKYIDETGNRYGKLQVISKSRKKTRKAFWDCLCDCGKTCTVRGDNLRTRTTSCGCDVLEKTYSKRGLKLGDSQFNALFSSYRSNAKCKKLPFLLTKEFFKSLVLQNCYYCGKIPSESFKRKGLKGEFIYNGVDRKDSTQGYTVENSLPCCTDCNYTKSNLPHDIFLEKIVAIYQHRMKSVKVLNT